MKTGNLDQEEASGIDNQGPLKAWMLFLTENKNNARNNKAKKEIWDRTLNQQDSNKIPENPLRMYNSDREEEDCL